MNASSLSNNPYPAGRGDVMLAPFAGRQKAFEQIYQQLTRTRSSVIMGAQESGKTAVLRHFSTYFEDKFIGIYVALKDANLQSEGDWLRTLAEATLNVLIERNMSLSRLVVLQPDSAHIREWFSETFLREVSKVARSQRLILLLDDADKLIDAMTAGRLPKDHLTFLAGLAKMPPEIGIALSLDSRYEADIPLLSPLADVTDIYRLENLSEDEAIWLLRKPVEDRFSVNDEAVKAVYRATGGQPRLLQRFGNRLYRLWETRADGTALTLEDVKTVTAQVYNQTEPDFERLWQDANRNERLILSAITQLQYADPLTAVTPEGIEGWLIESDFPLDMTAVHAALRSLEYEQVIDQTPAGIRITVGLLQTWLLENGRVYDKLTKPGTRRIRWIALILLLILLLVLALLGGLPGVSTTPGDVPPTVTLVSAP